MRRSGIILAITCFTIILLCSLSNAQPDSLKADTLPHDSLPSDAIPADTTAALDSLDVSPGDSAIWIDSLSVVDTVPAEKLPPLPPPINLRDSLAAYFARYSYTFEVQLWDMYPRNAAGFLEREASLFTMSAQETPVRTTVHAYGLPGNQFSVHFGDRELAPYDRTIPSDGLYDFDDFSTGNVKRADIIEGPLAGFGSLSGALVLLHLEPFDIPEETPVSQALAEMGSFGYSYTRGRFARMFSSTLGFAFSTDYRDGDGFVSNTDDNSYNINARLFKKVDRQTRADFSVSAYRRKGGYLSYRRLRRESLFDVAVTRQEILGGQMKWRYVLDLSRSADFTKTIRPRNTYTDMQYLFGYGDGMYQATVRWGREQYYINQYYAARYYGFGELAGYLPAGRGVLFFFGRVEDAEVQDRAYEGSVGYAMSLSPRWSLTQSYGYLNRWPDLTELYLMPRTWQSGVVEQGNLGLKPEKKMTGNITLAYTPDNASLSMSVNVGHIQDAIYYDRRYETSSTLTIMPKNDDIRFADLNLSGRVDSIWIFFGQASGTIRRLDSDRYGNNPPYSPRWQVYGRAGLRHYVDKYKVHLRAFGDIIYTEKPLSYAGNELKTEPIINWGINATLKDFTFFFIVHNAMNQIIAQPEDYGYNGWFKSWGFNWKFWD